MFSKLNNNDSVQVFFGDIDDEIVKVQAEKNLFPHIYTEVSNDTLHVYLSKNIKPSKKINIYLGAKKLSEITTTGTVILTSEGGFKADSLKIHANGISQISILRLVCNHLHVDIDGSSTVNLKGSALEQEVSMKGASVYKALGLLTDLTTISISGAGKAWVNAKERLNLSLQGAAYLGFSGDPEIQKSITGVGRLEQLEDR
ncbi:MAG: head GIN domain-containing protein [Chlamydiota bacterium]